MKTQACIGCGNPFEPRRKDQRFCSATCATRQRDRRRRRRLAAESASKAKSVAQAAEAQYDWRLTIARQQFDQELARQREAAERRRLMDMADRERHLDRLQTELRTLAANFDRQSGEQGELRALNVALEQEVRRLRQGRREDMVDLMFLASRVVLAASDAGFQVDERTSAVFRRRGWSLQAAQRQGQLA